MLVGFFAVGEDLGGREGRIGFEMRLGNEIRGVGVLFGEGGTRFLKFGKVLPEHVATVDDLAAAHVEEVDGEHVVFEVEAEDVGVVGGVGRGDALALIGLVYGDELVAETCGELKLHVLGGGVHAHCQALLEFVRLAVEEELHVADDLAVVVDGDEAFDTGAEAALDVVLQAGTRVVAVEVDLAAWDQEAAMDDVDEPVRQVAGKVRTEVGGAILAQAAGDEDLGVAVGEGELDVRVGLVVAQQDVEARLALLDEVVFERQGLVLVGDGDVFEVDGLAHERAGLGVGLRGGEEIAAHACTQILGLADVDDLALGVLVEVTAGARGQGTDFLQEIHG